MPTRPCPCGTGLPFDECCGPLHDGAVTAATAEQLMRSRYSAFVVGDTGHLRRTWHPRTCPETVRLDLDVHWTGLEVLATTGGTASDTEGSVEFRARSAVRGLTRTQHENSRFLRAGDRWLYLDGVAIR